MTIRLAIASDLHVEKGNWKPPAIEADLWVLAGDVGWTLEGVTWIAEHLGGRPAIYVAGNREYWHHAGGTDPIAALRRAAARVPGLCFLQDEARVFEIGGKRLRVLGATLWTDYRLEGDAEAAMARAAQAMPDYRNGRDSSGATLSPAAALAAGRASVEFLGRELAHPHDGPTIVVTHHLPSPRGLKSLRPGHVPTTASVNHLDRLIEERGPDLWVHGHSHWDGDYRIGATRVVSRQRGGPENEGFAPLMVDI